VKRAFQTLLTYIGNVAKNPDEEKFRKIRLTNATFQVKLLNLEIGKVLVILLKNMGLLIHLTGEGWKSAWGHRVP
jgi:hypothetical protein